MVAEGGLDPIAEGENVEERDRVLARALGKLLDTSRGNDDVSAAKVYSLSTEMAAELEGELDVLAEIDSLLTEPILPENFAGDFRIIRELGQGGMGVVYEAVQLSLDRPVALKVLAGNLAADATAVERFQREARVHAWLKHPNVATVHACGIEPGTRTPYYVMDLVEGETLSSMVRRLRREYANSSSRDGYEAYCVRIAEAFAGAAEGIYQAHVKQVTHRDLKPSNLVLDSTGRLIVLDFGIAKREGELGLTLSNEQVGTPLYMSPEQASGERVGPRSDIYSLGTTLYEMLSGRTPFSGTRRSEVLDKIKICDPPPLSSFSGGRVPAKLATIVFQCLRKNPQHRYATAEALAQDLRRYVRDEDIEAEPENPLGRALRRAWRSRKRLAVAVGSAALVFAAVAFVVNQLERRHQGHVDFYESKVQGAAMKLIDKQLTPLVREGAPRFSSSVAAEVEDRGRFAGWKKQLFDAGERVVDPGQVSTLITTDPALEAVNELEAAIALLPERPIAHYYLGRARMLQGRAKEALEAVNRAISLQPGFVPALSLKATLLVSTGDRGAEELRALVPRIAAESSNSWGSIWLEATSAMRSGAWEEAAHAYEKLVDQQSNAEFYSGGLMEALMGRGVALMRGGHPLEAARDFERAARDWPQWLQPGLLLGKASYLSDGKERAQNRFQSALERWENARKPKDEAAHAIATLYCFELGDDEAALSWAARMEPGRTRTLFEAEMLAYQGRFPEAKGLALEVLKSNAADPSARLTLGNVLLFEGNWLSLESSLVEARGHYEHVRDATSGDPRPFIQLGLCLASQGDLAGALLQLEEAEKLDPGSFAAAYNGARILGKLGRFDEAAARYRAILAIFPHNAWAWNNLGIVLEETSAHEAMDAYRKAVRFDPSFPIAHYNLAWALHREFRYPEAEQEYKEAIKHGMGERDGLVHAHLAACLFNQAKFEDAAREYRNCLKVMPDYTTAQVFLGSCLWMRGLKSDAKVAYEKALEMDPHHAEAHRYLGGVEERLGNTDRAIQLLRKAIELDPKDVWNYNDLSGCLLRSYQPLPLKEDLPREIAFWEKAGRLDDAAASISWLLDVYWRAALPKFHSFESIEARLSEPRRILDENSEWSFFRGFGEPTQGWHHGPLDDDWEKARAPFGFPATSLVSTNLQDMHGGYSTLYLRRTFPWVGPQGGRVTLAIRADDGAIAWVNGHEVLRTHAGTNESGPLPHDSVAEDFQWDPMFPLRVPIQDHLVAGENLIAIQGLNLLKKDPDFFLSAWLEAEGSSPASASVLRLIEEQEETEQAGDIGLYITGRRFQLEGNYREAIEVFRGLAPSSDEEPYLRLSESWSAIGDSSAAEAALRSGIENAGSSRKLWDRWLSIGFTELGWTALQALEALPAALNEVEGRRGQDIRWLLEALRDEGAIRVDCGSQQDCCRKRGPRWSKDRFYVGGTPARLAKLRRPEVHPVLWTERFFPGNGELVPAYSIPVPLGQYRVTLHLGEGYFDSPGKREFDVLLEDQVVESGHDPFQKGNLLDSLHLPGAVPYLLTKEVTVEDGSLDLTFRRRIDKPNVLGIEVQYMDRGSVGRPPQGQPPSTQPSPSSVGSGPQIGKGSGGGGPSTKR